MKVWLMLGQFLVAFILALVAGSVFGIWRGYDPLSFTPATFVEMHQGTVRGLNVLLPALGFAAIGLTAFLVWSARGRGLVFWLYLSAVLFMAAAGVTTRFFNQPINDMIVNWGGDAIPDNWRVVELAPLAHWLLHFGPGSPLGCHRARSLAQAVEVLQVDGAT